MKYLVAVLLIFQFGFTQDVNSTEAYKTVLRMKLNMDINPVFYLDEPQSAQMNKVHQSCVEYLDLYEAKVPGQQLRTQAKIINEIPFPIPLCVICSPSHIKKMVPATNVITVVNLK